MSKRIFIACVVCTLVLTHAAAAIAGHEGMVRLSHDPAAPATEIDQLVLTPDGTRALFLSDHNQPGTGNFELFSAPIGGGSPVQINDTPAPNGSVSSFRVSPDGTRVVYRGDLDMFKRTELYSRAIDGTGNQEKLNTTPAHAYSVSKFEITPDGTSVAFTGDLEVDDVVEIFTRDIDGSGPQVKVNDDHANIDGDVVALRVSPDGSRVVFTGDLDVAERQDLYSRPIDGTGTQTRLNDDPTHNDGNGGDIFPNPTVSADGSRVVYMGDLEVDGRNELYSRHIDGTGQQARLSTSPAHDFLIFAFQISPDGSRVIYRGDLTADDTYELYSRPIDGTGQQVRLNEGPAHNDGDGGHVLPGFKISEDGSRVAYRGDLDVDQRFDLYSRPIDGTGQQVRLNDTEVPQRSVFAFEISPDGSHVVFKADSEGGAGPQLLARPIDGSGTQTRIDDEPAHNGDTKLGNFKFSPDGGRLVYSGDLLVDDQSDLYSRAIDGTGPQVRLNDDPAHNDGDGGDIRDFLFSPDSSRVVFVGDLTTDTARELWSTDRGQLPPPSPSGVKTAGVTDTSAVVSWTATPATSEVDGYTVTLDPAPPPSPGRTAASTQSTTDTSIELTGLAPATKYTVSVTADNHGGKSSASVHEFSTLPAGGLDRLSGSTRYETAVAVALDRFHPADVHTVYLAVGSNFPDALTGGPLAAQGGAPILLTPTSSLPDVVAGALATLGPSKVVAFGGTAAITDDVLADAGAAAGAATDRISGANRFETAAAIADAMDTSGIDTAFLATGTNFPDALAGGPATDGAPILLTSSAGLPDATADALADLAPDTVTALGGTAAVSEATLDAAATAAGPGTATGRQSGPDRYLTATAIADTLTGVDTAYVAVGTNFPDALAAGPAAFAEGAPIVLTRTSTLPDTTAEYLDQIVGLRRIVILGGTAAINDDIATQLQALID